MDIRNWIAYPISVLNYTTSHLSQLGQFSYLRVLFRHIHIDVVSPPSLSNGFTHLFTCVDRPTCWPYVIPSGADIYGNLGHFVRVDCYSHIRLRSPVHIDFVQLFAPDAQLQTYHHNGTSSNISTASWRLPLWSRHPLSRRNNFR